MNSRDKMTSPANWAQTRARKLVQLARKRKEVEILEEHLQEGSPPVKKRRTVNPSTDSVESESTSHQNASSVVEINVNSSFQEASTVGQNNQDSVQENQTVNGSIDILNLPVYATVDNVVFENISDLTSVYGMQDTNSSSPQLVISNPLLTSNVSYTSNKTFSSPTCALEASKSVSQDPADEMTSSIVETCEVLELYPVLTISNEDNNVNCHTNEDINTSSIEVSIFADLCTPTNDTPDKQNECTNGENQDHRTSEAELVTENNLEPGCNTNGTHSNENILSTSSESNEDILETNSEVSGNAQKNSLLQEPCDCPEMQKAATNSGSQSRRYKPWSWKRNVNKKRREKGLPYKGVKKNCQSGKWEFSESKQSRDMKPICNCKLSGVESKLKCRTFTELERNKIFSDFWKILEWSQKKTYVSSLIDVKLAKDKKNKKNDVSRRTFSYEFHLKLNGIRTRVCRNMFINTLGIGRWSVLSWVQSHNDLPVQNGEDDHADDPGELEEVFDQKEPEKSKRSRILSDVKLQKKKTHLEEFLNTLPKMESHYCRQNTGKLYLETVWDSKTALFKFYEEECKSQDVEPVSYKTFQGTLKKLNLAIYLPKKDQCDICCSYKVGNVSHEEYTRHFRNKERAREEKIHDKSSADGLHVYTMDLEKVLLAPNLKASALYYKTKLCVHNFTLYNLKSKEGFCYIWHEGEGGISSHEFASIICLFFSERAGLKENETVVLFSDGANYQNRNAILSNALFHLGKIMNVTIVQKYLEKGHTQMECDSMHSCIERNLKNREIYTPGQYVDICKSARANPRPYEVSYLDHTFFKDYSGLRYASSIRPGNQIGDPQVVHIRALKYQSDGIYYKLAFDDDWKPLPRRLSTHAVSEVKALHLQPRKIKLQKFNDLQQLKTVIPSDFHSFYNNLLHE